MSFIGDMFNSSKGAGFEAQGATGQQVQQAMQNYQAKQQQLQDLYGQLQAQGGIQNQSSVFNQQQQLANQLQQRAAGGGPNPALAQLQQATGQNVANQAALMAGQRGAGANAGLIARQAAQQGAATQQNAAGQAAILAAQQQIAGQQALQGQQGMMANLATQQVGQQTGVGENLANLALQNQNSLFGSQQGQNQVNAGIAAGNQKGQQGLIGGLLGGAGSLMGMPGGGAAAKAYGGEIHHMADGGNVGPSSSVGKFFQGFGNSMNQQNPNDFNPIQSGMASFASGLGHQIGNALKPSLVQGQVGGLGSSDLQTMPNMAAHGGVMDYRSGGKLPGKAKTKGDSLKNDTVPILGSPGEIMIPRSIATHPDAPEKAKQFVAAILAKQNMGKKK